MRGNRVKKLILNPVLKTPWIAQFTEINKVRNPRNFVLNLTLDKNDVQDLCISKGLSRRYLRIPVHPTKAALTRIYTDQLKPNYPNFTKTHVKAALMLTDNNLEETRLMLDLKGRFERIRKQRNCEPLVHRRTNTSTGPVLLAVEHHTNNVENIRNNSAWNVSRINQITNVPTTVTQAVAPLGSFPTVQGISAISAIPAFVDTPMTTPNSDVDTASNSQLLITPVTVSNGSVGYSDPFYADTAECKNFIMTPAGSEVSLESTGTPKSVQSEEKETKKESISAVYDFSESDNQVSAPNFFKWKLSRIGTSKIKLRRNKIGVQILRKRDGYISNLL